MDNIVNNSPSETIGSNKNKSGRIKNARLDSIATGNDKVNIVEPSSPSHSQYPYNKVEKTISGHVREMDDTPGAERIFEMHSSGTFYEIHPDGSKITKVFGKDFCIVFDDSNLVIGGTRNITIQGDCNLLVAGNVKQKIGGNLETIVAGDMITRVSGKTLLYSKDDIDVQSRKNIRTRSKKKTEIHAIDSLTCQSKNDILIQADKALSQRGKQETNIQSGGPLYIRSGGLTKIFASGNLTIDGARVDLNLPSSPPNSNTMTSNDPKDKDPNFGLSVPKSISEPSLIELKINSTDLTNIQSGFDRSQLNYPRDRTSID